jgi:hypothetical protein
MARFEKAWYCLRDTGGWMPGSTFGIIPKEIKRKLRMHPYQARRWLQYEN